MLRLVVMIACVILATPVMAQSRSVTEDIGRRLEQDLRDSDRAYRRAIEREARSYSPQQYVPSDTYRRSQEWADRQRAYETDERLRLLEFEANERRYRIR